MKEILQEVEEKNIDGKDWKKPTDDNTFNKVIDSMQLNLSNLLKQK